ncbi:PREDICTED: uncharacterized protein LOC108359274 isoform X2 [Rhagoletis zephyria]|uniref:uncharacterized protein LOC108359274 isoform X2 n=1 Tax=Rhagoletis zephyria TaxID=28612 RepID=UPI0008114F49|nr:PREDICTED: uncharacterized protein LOC108359274 isoform X2 [Rhagoletis zephyria]
MMKDLAVVNETASELTADFSMHNDADSNTSTSSNAKTSTERSRLWRERLNSLTKAERSRNGRERNRAGVCIIKPGAKSSVQRNHEWRERKKIMHQRLEIYSYLTKDLPVQNEIVSELTEDLPMQNDADSNTITTSNAKTSTERSRLFRERLKRLIAVYRERKRAGGCIIKPVAKSNVQPETHSYLKEDLPVQSETLSELTEDLSIDQKYQSEQLQPDDSYSSLIKDHPVRNETVSDLTEYLPMQNDAGSNTLTSSNAKTSMERSRLIRERLKRLIAVYRERKRAVAKSNVQPETHSYLKEDPPVRNETVSDLTEDLSIEQQFQLEQHQQHNESCSYLIKELPVKNETVSDLTENLPMQNDADSNNSTKKENLNRLTEAARAGVCIIKPVAISSVQRNREWRERKRIIGQQLYAAITQG